MIDAAWLTLLQAAQGRERIWRDLLTRSGSAEALVRESRRTLVAAGLDDAAIRRLHSPDSALLGRWERWLGARGAFVGMKGFGASAKASDLFEHFGITAEAIAAAARRLAQ